MLDRMKVPISWRHCMVGMLIALGCATNARAADKWIRLEAEGVTLYSEAPASDATEFMVSYLGYRHTFATLFGRADQPLAPVHILLYRKRESVTKISGASDVLALTALADGDVILAMSMDSDRKSALQTIFEFDTASGLQRIGYFLPLWMEQGTGSVMATLAMEKDNCVVGARIDWMGGTLTNEKWMEWDRLSHVRTGTVDYAKAENFQVFAAQSCAMMRLVLLREPDKAREHFLALVDEIHRTPRADLAVAKVMNIEAAAVMPEVKRQMRENGRLAVPFDRQEARGKIKTDSAPPVDVAVDVASLTIAHNSNSVAADAALQRASSLGPDNPRVLEAMARRELKWGNRTRAAEYYRSAIAAGSMNPRAYVQSARARLDDVMSNGMDQPGQGGSPVVDALAEIRQALKLNPGDGEAYMLLGRALFVSETVTEADLTEVVPGFHSPDYGFLAQFEHALLQLRLDHYDEAVAALRRLLQDETIAAEKRKIMLQNFAAQNFNLVKTRVELQVHSRDFELAQALLKQRLDPTEWNVIADLIQRLSRWVDVSIALDGMEQLDASTQANELRAARKAFVAKYPDEPASKQIQAMLDEESHAGK